jgi:hypothetical protein
MRICDDSDDEEEYEVNKDTEIYESYDRRIPRAKLQEKLKKKGFRGVLSLCK